MRKCLPGLFVLIFFLPLFAGAQVFNGRVLDETGKNASNVTVRLKNKASIANTDMDGNFKLANPIPGDTLVFSAPGMETYQVVVNEKNMKDASFEVVLLNTRKQLSEVTVTAFGTAFKKDLTYATTNKVAGVTVTDKKVEAEPTKNYRVRGFSTSAGATPRNMALPPAGKTTPATFYAETASISSTTGGIKHPGYSGDTARTPGRSPGAKLITAGEVNDFNKWKMWEDYSANEFKNYSAQWGLHSKNRFSIQVTDKSHNAVVNQPLFLINSKTGDTAWKAYTDNTGKAELWAGFFSDSANADDYYVVDNKGTRIRKPSSFLDGINKLTIDQPCNISYDVDIAFVVDATGSMGDEIEFLKLELEDVIRNTMDKYKSLSLRAASVFYRDKRDLYLTKKVAFHDDLLKTLNFIKLQNASGGGDFPEAVDDALANALDSLEWNKNARTKLLFLILDAPPHADARERMQKLILKAAAMGVRIIPIACSGTDKSTEFLLRSMALATNGTYTFLTNHSGIGNSHIEPTTDKYDVELLNDLLQRVTGQYLFAKECNKEEQQVQPDIQQPDNLLGVKIYPNPTNGRFVIESKKDITQIFIADFTGKILMKLGTASKKGRWQVDISNYPSGVYLVKYVTADNKWGAEKVILMR